MKKNLFKKLFALSLAVVATAVSLCAMEVAGAADQVGAGPAEAAAADVDFVEKIPCVDSSSYSDVWNRCKIFELLVNQIEDPKAQQRAFDFLVKLYVSWLKMPDTNFDYEIVIRHCRFVQRVTPVVQVQTWCVLGCFYRDGNDVVEKDPKKARLYLSKVVEQVEYLKKCKKVDGIDLQQLVALSTLATKNLVKLGDVKNKVF